MRQVFNINRPVVLTGLESYAFREYRVASDYENPEGLPGVVNLMGDLTTGSKVWDATLYDITIKGRHHGNTASQVGFYVNGVSGCTFDRIVVKDVLGGGAAIHGWNIGGSIRCVNNGGTALRIHNDWADSVVSRDERASLDGMQRWFVECSNIIDLNVHLERSPELLEVLPGTNGVTLRGMLHGLTKTEAEKLNVPYGRIGNVTCTGHFLLDANVSWANSFEQLLWIGDFLHPVLSRPLPGGEVRLRMTDWDAQPRCQDVLDVAFSSDRGPRSILLAQIVGGGKADRHVFKGRVSSTSSEINDL